jgi:hypothetical protein
LEFPNIPKKYLPDFIRGVIDGDGSIMFSKPRSKNGKTRRCTVVIVSASKRFIDGVLTKTNALGTKGRIFTVKPHREPRMVRGHLFIEKNPYYRWIVDNRTVVDFLKYIYYDNDIICLERKRKIAAKVLKYFSDYVFNTPKQVPTKSNLLQLLKTKSIYQIMRKYKISHYLFQKWLLIRNIRNTGKWQTREGQVSANAKLTIKQVKRIKRMFAKGASYGDVMKVYSISLYALFAIRSNKTWKHVSI